jgi:hypothetical protein
VNSISTHISLLFFFVEGSNIAHQEQGNDIYIYPTSNTTATSSRETPEKNQPSTKKPGYLKKKIRRLGAFIGQLFKKKEEYQKKPMYQRKPPRMQKFIWCFRPVGTSAAFKSSAWTEFERKNQLELSRQLGLLSNRHTASHSFEIQDKHILDNTVVTIMLKEGIAFVLDPEWSKPIVYEITCRPKLHWFSQYGRYWRLQRNGWTGNKFPKKDKI